MPVNAKPIALYNWTGCFLGGNVGSLWATKEWYARDTSLGAALGAYYGSHNVSTWAAGVQAGCDYQFGSFVIGVQGDYDWSIGEGSNNNLLNATYTDRSKIKSVAAVTGRLGYAWDRTLFYVRGGVAWERDNYDLFLRSTGASAFTAGYTVGAGVEIAVLDNWTAFAEYSYYDVGTRANTFGTVGGPTAPGIDIKEHKNVVRFGFNYRFGAGAVVANY